MEEVAVEEIMEDTIHLEARVVVEEGLVAAEIISTMETIR